MERRSQNAEKMWRIFYWLPLLAVIVLLVIFLNDCSCTKDSKNIKENGPLLEQSLFSMINTTRSKTSSLTETQEAVTNTSLELKERQEQLEMKVLKFMEKTDKYISNSEERQENLETQFFEKSEKSFLNLKKRQENLEAKLLEFMEKNEKYFSNSEKRQLPPTVESDAFVETTENDLMTMQTGRISGDSNGNHNLDKSEQWTTIARRQDGSVDFNRNWAEYQNGFGNPDGEFFIGLEKLHNLTTQGAPQELLIVLKDIENNEGIAKYDNFEIGNAEEKYELLKLGEYSGDAGDALVRHKNMKFSTYDSDNDNDTAWSCAHLYEGGWWFENCCDSHFFGRYGKQYIVFWRPWTHDPLKLELRFVEMKVRAKLK